MSINKEDNLQISEETLNQINEELTLIPHNDSISISSLEYKSKLSQDIILKLLIALAEKELIKENFLISCADGEEGDYIHKFLFESHEKFDEFMKKNFKKCPDCGKDLNYSDVMIYFTAKLFKIRGGEL